MKELTHDHLDDVARGAAILGTGGGGDPYIGRLLAAAAVREHGPVPLVALEEVPDDAMVLPVAMMGAPTVMVEKLPSAEQVGLAARTLAGYLGKELTHIACAEAGGVNSLIPVVAAAQLGLPLVDADGMGRAFPELQMVLPTIYGVRATPMAYADEKGNRGVLDTVDNHWAERLARSAAIDMGCSSAISTFAMSGAQARESMVPGTLSLCAELGRLARSTKSVAAVVERLGGRTLFTGKVIDVARRTQTGFARGEARLSGMDDDAGRELVLRFQNEHLVAERDGVVLASVPDLICVLHTETSEAVTTELLRFGQRVTVIAAPADPRWHTEAGIELAGPRYFGYDIDPVGVTA
ncbi:DUF917 domain-containing protein [Amycolatopsis acidiphila]|uniref:DUF917 domain-containing protein n=1 Tax=Amycolatopsis acidiphila TaxID=715473 RepID=A0A558AAE7_9PSEU|nr:DUF917 domain-containing protein [Amycolatopsis acidiphila]TVT21233.1 DUF917 domain-containing protein [Amycolatopsis acidiphila]UIJ61250.1 DUF917 domain-containing protein [Amycolatopsis acidiphila]GHG78585.1 hypothetical protein GCM10017788_45960 [Amycolatopsis acidiphila]